MRRQRTFRVDGQAITIRTWPLTSVGNLRGWHVDINGTRTKHYVLTRAEAEDLAYVRWVKALA